MRKLRPYSVTLRLSLDEITSLRALLGDSDADRLRALLHQHMRSESIQGALRTEIAGAMRQIEAQFDQLPGILEGAVARVLNEQIERRSKP